MNIYLYTNVLCHECATVAQAARLQSLDALVDILLDDVYITLALTWLSIFLLHYSHIIWMGKNGNKRIEAKYLQ